MEHQRLWVSVFTAIIGVAIVAVILSKNAATGSVIQAATGGLGSLLQIAVSPITSGNSASPGGFGQFSQPSGASGGIGQVGSILQNVNSLSQAAGGLVGNGGIWN